MNIFYIKNNNEYFQNKRYKKLLNIDDYFKDKTNDIMDKNIHDVNNNLVIIATAASANPNIYGTFLLLSIAGWYFYYTCKKLKNV